RRHRPTVVCVCCALYYYCPLRAVHSFPTRRSSDLGWCFCTVFPAIATNGKKWARRLPTTHGCMLISQVMVVRRRLASMDLMMSPDRKSTRLNSSHVSISYAVFCLKKKNTTRHAIVP